MNSAEMLGQLIGLGISIFLPLIAIILNAVSLRRHRTNIPASLGVICTCLGLILLTFSGLGFQTSHVPFKVVRILAISGISLMGISTILSIIGLVQCQVHRRRYARGRSRAVIALILNVLFLTLFTVNTVQGVNQGLALRKLLQLPTPVGVAVTNDAWNFKVMPPEDWDPINPAAFGGDVYAALGRHHPEMYALITAEVLPEGTESALEGAMALLKHTLRNDGQVEFVSENETLEGGYPSRTLEMRTKKTTGDFFHIYWMTHRNGVLYRISTWGADSQTSMVRDETRKIINGFEQVDPKRMDPKSSKKTLASL